jgi:hypothetical protein
MFGSFKKESDKMNKRLKGLDKEKREAVAKAEKAEKNLLLLADSNESQRKELGALRKQKEGMEKLCRTLTQVRLCVSLRRPSRLRGTSHLSGAPPPLQTPGGAMAHVCPLGVSRGCGARCAGATEVRAGWGRGGLTDPWGCRGVARSGQSSRSGSRSLRPRGKTRGRARRRRRRLRRRGAAARPGAAGQE